MRVVSKFETEVLSESEAGAASESLQADGVDDARWRLKKQADGIVNNRMCALSWQYMQLSEEVGRWCCVALSQASP